jgi:uncharacterized phage-associated protein
MLVFSVGHAYTSIGAMGFNEQKATALAVYFMKKAGGQIEYLKLMKLLYLAERRALRATGVSITGDKFFSMDRGPVLSRTLDLIKSGQEDPSVWSEHISAPTGYRVRLLSELDPTLYLSEAELKMASEIWSEFGKKNKWDIVELTHTFAEWKDPGGSCEQITLRQIYEALDLPEELIRERLEEQRAREALDELLAEARD